MLITLFQVKTFLWRRKSVWSQKLWSILFYTTECHTIMAEDVCAIIIIIVIMLFFASSSYVIIGERERAIIRVRRATAHASGLTRFTLL